MSGIRDICIVNPEAAQTRLRNVPDSTADCRASELRSAGKRTGLKRASRCGSRVTRNPSAKHQQTAEPLGGPGSSSRPPTATRTVKRSLDSRNEPWRRDFAYLLCK